MTIRPSTDWVDHCVWWQVYPLGFSGAPASSAAAAPPGRGLAGLIEWLDYAVRLGASGLALGPIFTASTHGYDTLDHYSVDPRLGDEADFDALVEACHRRGLRLMLDGVFNHVGADHPWLRQALAEGPAGPRADWFKIDWSDPGQPHPWLFEGHPGLVELNHANEAVAAEVQRVMTTWLERGADAWRLDAAYRVPPAFWGQVLPPVRRRHPTAWFVGEVIHGDYAGYVAESGLDAVTQYELWKAAWSALASANFFELDWTLGRHNAWLDSFQPLTFLGNHDVTRLATAVGPDKLVLALAVLLTVGGVPSIYYGDEQGFTGHKYDRPGGDDEIRPVFPASPAELSPLGQWVYRAHQDLIGLRRRQAWLVGARTQTVELSNLHYRYLSQAEEDRIEVVLDLEPDPRVEIRSASGARLYAWPD
ncbi:MAG: alpha-amylase [Propionibacteriaceae bacterium]|jgi:glycosidase|nr:alpha-amylase [Propionibacteriaceae bacterium]